MFADVYRNRRVFVTGHTGFKGSWLTQWLLELGASVTGYSIDVPTQPALFELLGLEKRITHHQGDVCDLESLRKAMEAAQPEIVFHLAAQAIVTTSFEDPLRTFTVNAIGTGNVLECLRGLPSVRAAVMITSDKCYENVEWEYGYREGDRLGGSDPYSASKAAAELIISSYVRSFLRASPDGIQIASARAGNVIGGGDWAKDRIIPDCIRAWTRKESAELRNPGSTRPWQHVLEPLSGYLQLGSLLWDKQPGLHGEPFNFGPHADVVQPVSTLVEQLQTHWPAVNFHVRSSAPQAPVAKKEAGLLKLCCDKALHRMGWAPTLTFPETVAFTGKWYEGHVAGKTSARDSTLDQLGTYHRLALERGRPWTR